MSCFSAMATIPSFAMITSISGFFVPSFSEDGMGAATLGVAERPLCTHNAIAMMVKLTATSIALGR